MPDLQREALLFRSRTLRRWLMPALLGLVVLFPACGGDDDPIKPAASPPPTPFVEDSLVFRTSGGTVIEMGDSTFTCCGLFDPSFANEPAIRIMLHDPALLENAWSITLLTGATTPGSVHTLPTKVVAPHKVPSVLLFVHGGEYSSEPDESSGTITLHSFECGASTTSVDFSVDATLQSEYWDGGQVTAKGRFRAVFPRNECPD